MPLPRPRTEGGGYGTSLPVRAGMVSAPVDGGGDGMPPMGKGGDYTPPMGNEGDDALSTGF